MTRLSTILFLLFITLNKVLSNCFRSHVNHEIDGKLTINVLLDASDTNCERSLQLTERQIVSLTLIVERLNYLSYLNGLVLGVRIFDTCSSTNRRVNTLLELYLNESKKCSESNTLIPVVTSSEIAMKIQQFSKLFDYPIMEIPENRNHELLVDAAIQFLATMNFNQDIILFSNSDTLEELFNLYAKVQWLCVRNSFKISGQQIEINKSDVLVVFGDKEEISELLSKISNKYWKPQWILVPLDESIDFEVLPPNNSYIIRASQEDPILLNVIQPILKIVKSIHSLIETKCQNLDDPTLLFSCVQTQYHYTDSVDVHLTDYELLQTLQFEELHNQFYYEIQKLVRHETMFGTHEDGNHSNMISSDTVTNQKICTYNKFNRSLHYENDNLRYNDTKYLCKLPDFECLVYCNNFNKYREKFIPTNAGEDQINLVIRWKTEAWVAALVSISAIGFFSTLSVLMFILVRLIKGDILEGNPTSSILLLLVLLLMYATVLPFAIVLEHKPITNDEEAAFNYMLQSRDQHLHPTTILPDFGINQSQSTTIEYENTTEGLLYQFEDSLKQFVDTLGYEDENTNEINMTNTTDFIDYVNYSSLIHPAYLPLQMHYKAENENVADSDAIPKKSVRNVITYETVIEYQNLLCTYTVFGISFLYAFAFAVLLSRFIVVATIGHDGGFMSHVNGYIQSTLCFFMTLVQIGFNSELWLLDHDCDTIFSGNFVLILMSYDIFLLFLLACISPFVMRSQRNYKEGIMASVSIYIICFIWAFWIALYYLTGKDWRNILLISGMISTASVLLVGVFIPRTYLMMTGIARDRLANALPSLAHTQSTSILDINFRTSSQATFGCVNPVPISSILQNSAEFPPPLPARHCTNYYSEAPDDGCMTEEHQNTFNEDNTYERYDTPPSPTKITRF